MSLASPDSRQNHHNVRMISRRQIITLTPLLALPGASALHAADELLKDSDSDAQAIDYVSDARQVDRKRFAQYQPGQSCANCAIYTADPGATHGACAIVFGKFVSAGGWCSAYEKKPA
jgi:hypothetical protein